MIIMCDSEKMGLPRPPPSNEWTQQNIMMINPPTGTAAAATTSSSSSGSKVAAVGGGGGAMALQQDPLKCPRCDSSNTKFCYYNNYSLAQPRHFCKACKRYWTRGGTLRNVPVGGGCRKNKRVKKHQSAVAAAALPSTTPATAPVTVSSSSSAMVGAPPQTSSQIRSSSDLISSFFYGTSDTNLGLNYTSFPPQFSALGFNSGIMNSIQPSSTMASYGNQGVMANYDNTLANSLGLMKGVKVEGGQSTNPNSSAVESWQVMNSTTNPFDQGFSVDSNPSNYLYWSNSADPASSSLAPLF